MPVLSFLTVPASNFVFERIFAAHPSVRIRFESAVPVGGRSGAHAWVAGMPSGEIERAFGTAASLADVTVCGVDGDETLVSLRWEEPTELLDLLTETDATALDVVGVSGGWRFALRFPKHENLSTFFEGCQRRGIGVSIGTVQSPGYSVDDVGRPRLTDPQREALALALREGYYDIPRRISLNELAERLGISDSAASQRIRRGSSELVERSLPVAERSRSNDGGTSALNRVR
jgi:hypothetical protein